MKAKPDFDKMDKVDLPEGPTKRKFPASDLSVHIAESHLYVNIKTGLFRFVATLEFNPGGDLDMDSLELRLDTPVSAQVNAVSGKMTTRTFTIFENQEFPSDWPAFSFSVNNEAGDRLAGVEHKTAEEEG